MKQWCWYFNLILGMLAIAIFAGCQNTDQKKELVDIKDIDYDPKTKTTLVTVEHQGGCKKQSYQYEYQELNSSATAKTLTYGLFVDVSGRCKKKALQFIRIPTPQSAFSPDQLIFQSSDNKKIIFLLSKSQTIAQIQPEQSPKITTIENVSFNQAERTITVNAFIPEGCGDKYTHKYRIIEQNSSAKSASLALITEVTEECDYGDHTTIKTPLPELSFQPEKLVFPMSEAKKIVLAVPSNSKK